VSSDKLARHSAVFNGGRAVVSHLNFGLCVNLLPPCILVIVFFLSVQRFLPNIFDLIGWCLSLFYVDLEHHNKKGERRTGKNSLWLERKKTGATDGTSL